MSEFTKGEWKIDTTGVYAESENEIISGNIICDSPVHFNDSMKNWQANAKLIACAPLMLELLYRIVDSDYASMSMREQAKQLIKKATEL